jgi:hypothetical protein
MSSSLSHPFHLPSIAAMLENAGFQIVRSCSAVSGSPSSPMTVPVTVTHEAAQTVSQPVTVVDQEVQECEGSDSVSFDKSKAPVVRSLIFPDSPTAAVESSPVTVRFTSLPASKVPRANGTGTVKDTITSNSTDRAVFNLDQSVSQFTPSLNQMFQFFSLLAANNALIQNAAGAVMPSLGTSSPSNTSPAQLNFSMPSHNYVTSTRNDHLSNNTIRVCRNDEKESHHNVNVIDSPLSPSLSQTLSRREGRKVISSRVASDPASSSARMDNLNRKLNK